MTVRDNIFLGTDHLFRYGRRKGAELETSRQALHDLGLDGLDTSRPMWMLSLAERQLVTIPALALNGTVEYLRRKAATARQQQEQGSAS